MFQYLFFFLFNQLSVLILHNPQALQVMCYSFQSHMWEQSCNKFFKAIEDHKPVLLARFGLCKLTDFTIDGRPHSVLSSLLLWRRPCLSVHLSKTSTPITLGFMGLGYFCIAALVTVSQGWLFRESHQTKILLKHCNQSHKKHTPADYLMIKIQCLSNQIILSVQDKVKTENCHIQLVFFFPSHPNPKHTLIFMQNIKPWVRCTLGGSVVCITFMLKYFKCCCWTETVWPATVTIRILLDFILCIL